MITINAGQSTSFPRIADAIEAAKAYAPMPVTIHIAPGTLSRKADSLTASRYTYGRRCFKYDSYI